ASSVNVIMAQRLVRKLCPKCKKKETIHPEALRELGVTSDDVFDIYKAEGCTACSNTGYSGRTGLYEVMPISDALREMILNRASASEIKEQAVREGMSTLRGDGIHKLKNGITSLEEVLRESAA
ncbi:MAG: type II secretion system protein GspE, partial [Candidatus Krumholzibacteria bacterium]|nr:type II secretion system protein GspE [Candidatus Krumholzibacteria bacterium]